MSGSLIQFLHRKETVFLLVDHRPAILVIALNAAAAIVFALCEMVVYVCSGFSSEWRGLLV